MAEAMHEGGLESALRGRLVVLEQISERRRLELAVRAPVERSEDQREEPRRAVARDEAHRRRLALRRFLGGLLRLKHEVTEAAFLPRQHAPGRLRSNAASLP